ncbi:uncharacterized protein H6S33_008713 [Morchella sextelata]|uniref:uncharacterized protein n=1 Tax=Morchella sextelata TaxID=1174677 RepID=UPI001D0406FE|nr:uncharacterized protein H6S33_008713 [Morchella sextelata]KAH0602374.1 hypothetical protein H6S33_008713 [Morchella sextelata]
MEDHFPYDQPFNFSEPDIINELLNELSAPSARAEQNDAISNPGIDIFNIEAPAFDIEDFFPWGFEAWDRVEQANDGSRFGFPLPTSMIGANLPEYEAQNVQQQGSSDSSVYATRNGRFDLVVESEPGPSCLPACRPLYNYTGQHNSHSGHTELHSDVNPLDIPMFPSDLVFMTPPPEPNENGKQRKREEALSGNNNPVPAGSIIGAKFRCTHPECKRTKGFTRKHNLTQHRRLVHKEPIPIVRYRWGIPPEGDSGRKTQRRRGATAGGDE